MKQQRGIDGAPSEHVKTEEAEEDLEQQDEMQDANSIRGGLLKYMITNMEIDVTIFNNMKIEV